MRALPVLVLGLAAKRHHHKVVLAKKEAGVERDGREGRGRACHSRHSARAKVCVYTLACRRLFVDEAAASAAQEGGTRAAPLTPTRSPSRSDVPRVVPLVPDLLQLGVAHVLHGKGVDVRVLIAALVYLRKEESACVSE